MKSLLACDQKLWNPGCLSVYKNWPGQSIHFDESLNEASFSFTHGKECYILASLWPTKKCFILQLTEEKMLELSISILPDTQILSRIF